MIDVMIATQPMFVIAAALSPAKYSQAILASNPIVMKADSGNGRKCDCWAAGSVFGGV